MIDFEHRERGKLGCDAKCGRVEAGAQHDITECAARNGRCQCIIAEAAPQDYERAAELLFRFCVPIQLPAQFRFGFGPDDRKRQRIAQHATLLENLMGRPMKRHALRSPARDIGVHIL
jgi:hypothetical protein